MKTKIIQILIIFTAISLSACSPLSLLTPSKPLLNASLDAQKGDRNYDASLVKKTTNAAGGQVSGSNQQNIKGAQEVNVNQGISELTWLVTVLVFGGISFLLGCIAIAIIVLYIHLRRDNKKLRDCIDRLKDDSRHIVFN